MSDKDVSPSSDPEWAFMDFFSHAQNGTLFPKDSAGIVITDISIYDFPIWVITARTRDQKVGSPAMAPVRQNNPDIPGEMFPSIAVFVQEADADAALAAGLPEHLIAQKEKSDLGTLLNFIYGSAQRKGFHFNWGTERVVFDPIHVRRILYSFLSLGEPSEARASEPMVCDEYMEHNLYPVEFRSAQTTLEALSVLQPLIEAWQIRGAVIKGRYANVLDVIVKADAEDDAIGPLCEHLYSELLAVTPQLCLDVTKERTFPDRRRIYGPQRSEGWSLN